MNTDAFSFDWIFPCAVLWGLMMWGAFMGWGYALGEKLFRAKKDNDMGWGTAGATGVAIYLMFCGPLLASATFSPVFVAIFVAAGIVLLVWNRRFFQDGANALREINLAGLRVPFVGLMLFVCLNYVGAAGTNYYNQNDDLAAYFPLTKMMLDTGTMYDPFSFRLLGALGGQLALDGSIVAFLPWKYVNLVDIGIAGLILFGLVQETVREGNRRAWIARILLVLFAMMCPMPRANTASEVTTVIVFMALFRSFEWVATRRIVGWRASLLLGVMMAAAATLRAPNVFIMTFLGLSFGLWCFWENRDHWKESLSEAAITIGIVMVALAPWWMVAYHSGGSFLYPLFRGNHRPEFQLFNHSNSLIDKFQFLAGFLIAYAYIPFFLPLAFVAAGRERRALLVLGGIIFMIGAALVMQFTFALYRDLNRYVIPLAFAFGLYTTGIVGRQLATSTEKGMLGGFRRTRLAAWMAVIIILAQCPVFFFRSLLSIVQIEWALDARHHFMTQPIGPVFTDDVSRTYAQAFEHIPPGAKTLIALDYPYLLDYRGHSIFSVDVAGAASPSPGLPYFHGSEPVKSYLLSQGIRYIAHVPFERADFLHSRKSQAASLLSPYPAYRYYATFEIDFFNNIDELARTNRVLYDSPVIQIIDLQNQ